MPALNARELATLLIPLGMISIGIAGLAGMISVKLGLIAVIVLVAASAFAAGRKSRDIW